MASQYMLTTVDNPYNPFTDFEKWFLYDVQQDYNTCSYLARMINETSDMSDKELDDETERAIDTIIKNDFLNIYKKITADYDAASMATKV